MKRIIASLILLAGIGLPISLFGQSAIEITGTIKSSQGALQSVEVAFFGLDDEFLGNCISGPDGKFKSQYKLGVGRTIKIKISRTGYEPFEKTFKIDKIGNAGEFMLLRKMLTISGFVKDSMSELPLTKTEISFFDESKLIQSGITNSQGYFDIETGFTYGQKIIVRVSKGGYHDKEQTLTFTSEGRNILQDIMLPQIGDRGLRAFIRVVDKKKRKALSGVAVQYFDKKKSTYRDTMVSSAGELELKLYQRPGTTLDLKLTKPNYRTLERQPTLSEEPLNNVFIYELEKDRRSALGPALLIGGGAAALLGGGMYLASNSKYESYKDFSNVNRESDYTKAQNQRNMSAVGAGVAAGAFVGYILYKISLKNKEKAFEQKRKRTGFKKFSTQNPSYAGGNKHSIGIVYQF